MKTKLTLIFIFISFLSQAQTVKDLDLENGFNTVKFGDSMSKYPSIKVFEYSKDSIFSFARRVEDNNLFPGANYEVVYTLFKGCVSNVFIGTRDSASSRIVLKHLQSKYGAGKKEDPYLERYLWYGSKVILSYSEDVNRFTTKVFFNSIPMQMKIEGRN